MTTEYIAPSIREKQNQYCENVGCTETCATYDEISFITFITNYFPLSVFRYV